MLNKLSILEEQTQDTSAQSSLMLSKHSELKKELEKYKSIVERFTFSSERLNMLLKDQWAVFNRAKLGYKPLNKQRTVENLFIKFIPKKQKSIACYCCGKIGHKSYVCNSRPRTIQARVRPRIKNGVPSAKRKVTQVWVSRGTNPRNIVVSKKSWIPKLT